jgi:hypothetical protein
MKHYQVSAEAFIGWIRIARPGSVLGPQQFYLPQVEHLYLRNSPTKKRRGEHLEMSPVDKIKSIKGEDGQANYLLEAKERNSEQKWSAKKPTRM